FLRILFFFYFLRSLPTSHLHSFPTRRSSDLTSSSKQLLCDPWLVGSAYWRSWWNYPPVPDGLVETLHPDFIYLTHMHWDHFHGRSEEHTSELQSLRHLVCRLLLEKKKKISNI